MSAPLVIPYFIPHQGCPHRCVFCNQSLITSKHSRNGGLPDLRELDRVIQEYLAFKGDRPRVELAFFGGNFLGLPAPDIKHLLERVSVYLERGEVDSIRCSTRPDTITEERLELVRAYRLDLVELGVQSMDDKVLGRAGRGHTREDTVRAVQKLKEAGIRVGVQVMAGLPGDSHQGALDTAGTLADLSPDLARIYPVLVLAGSTLARWYETGRYTPLGLEEAVAQVKGMAGIFDRQGIPVVRMGLQASEMMDDPSQVLAGPWHPAFGHLVFSALMFETACEEIDRYFDRVGKRGVEQVALIVHPRSLSRLQGNKKENLEKLAGRYPGLTFSIVTDNETAKGRVRVKKALP